MRKYFITLAAIFCMTVLAPVAAYAGEWRSDDTGWWYVRSDGSYPAGQWEWVDSDGDGMAECYYFYPDGYMAYNNDIDGNYVDDEGRWTVSGKVEKKAVGTASASLTDTGQQSRNRMVMEAARQMILDGTWHSGGQKANQFAVVDLNGDGLLEVLVEHFTSGWVNDVWDPMASTVIYYGNGRVCTAECGHELTYFEGADPAHGWFSLGRTRGKAINTIMSFSPAYGVTEVDGWFDFYERPEDAGKTEYYFKNMREFNFVPVNASEMDTYLTGEGRTTGLGEVLSWRY